MNGKISPTQQFTITLDRPDLDQLLEGLSERAESWERTGEALRIRRLPNGRLFIADEEEYPSEADRIAARYREVMDRILEQAAEGGFRV